MPAIPGCTRCHTNRNVKADYAPGWFTCGKCGFTFKQNPLPNCPVCRVNKDVEMASSISDGSLYLCHHCKSTFHGSETMKDLTPYCSNCGARDKVVFQWSGQVHWCNRCSRTVGPAMAPPGDTFPACPRCKKTQGVAGPFAGPKFHCTECRLYFDMQTPISPDCPDCGDSKYVKNTLDSQHRYQCSYCNLKFNYPVEFLQLIPGDLTMFYVVLNSQMQPQSPDQSGWYRTIAAEGTHGKLYFDEGKKDLAERFAEWLAQKNEGQRYYLSHITDFVQTVKPPVQWKNKANTPADEQKPE